MKILVAEDNEQLRNATVRLLERMGHEVSAFEDGAEALAASREGAFDLVVSDLDMPRMSGLQLYEQLAPHLQRRFILHSGNHEALDGLAGTMRVVPKGQPAAELRRAVAEALTPEDPG